MKRVIVTGSFDDLRSRQVRLLQEAAKLGQVHAVLWPDETILSLKRKAPKFLLPERLYVVGAIRYVSSVSVATGPVEPDAIPMLAATQPDLWVVDQPYDNARKRAFCERHGFEYRVLENADLTGFPVIDVDLKADTSPRKKVIVTGCFDWFHSGHVRFFEEVSALGDLYVVVGHDANIRLLKGDGHPMFGQDERRYMVQSVRYVNLALISSGYGWMDAEPEIYRLKPDIYAVNEEGDKPDKRVFCEKHGLEYVVLKREPKEGLPRRESTALRGF